MKQLTPIISLRNILVLSFFLSSGVILFFMLHSELNRFIALALTIMLHVFAIILLSVTFKYLKSQIRRERKRTDEKLSRELSDIRQLQVDANARMNMFISDFERSFALHVDDNDRKYEIINQHTNRMQLTYESEIQGITQETERISTTLNTLCESITTIHSNINAITMSQDSAQKQIADIQKDNVVRMRELAETQINLINKFKEEIQQDSDVRMRELEEMQTNHINKIKEEIQQDSDVRMREFAEMQTNHINKIKEEIQQDNDVRMREFAEMQTNHINKFKEEIQQDSDVRMREFAEMQTNHINKIKEEIQQDNDVRMREFVEMQTDHINKIKEEIQQNNDVRMREFVEMQTDHINKIKEEIQQDNDVRMREFVEMQTDHINKINEEIQQEKERMNRSLAGERNQRILGLTRRDTAINFPSHCLFIISIQRCGSTWMMDMLRSHPLIGMDPSWRIFMELGLNGGRYPMGLANGHDSEIEFEINMRRGAMIPLYKYPHTNDNSDLSGLTHYSLEKIHPSFYEFQMDNFLEHIEKIKTKYGTQVYIIYQFREPRSTITSFVNYQHRDPKWYADYHDEKLFSHIEKSYAGLVELSQILPSYKVDFNDLMQNPSQALKDIFQWLWPNHPTKLIDLITEYATETTRRVNRIKQNKTQFLGETPGLSGQTSEEVDILISKYQSQFDKCQNHYHSLSSKS